MRGRGLFLCINAILRKQNVHSHMHTLDPWQALDPEVSHLSHELGRFRAGTQKLAQRLFRVGYV